jgi:hypothetical protein
MMVQKQANVDAFGHGIEFFFHKNKIDRIDGWARLRFSAVHQSAQGDRAWTSGTTVIDPSQTLDGPAADPNNGHP